MKTLKLLNKKFFSILIFYLLSIINAFAEDKPVDIWNIEKKETDTVIETNFLGTLLSTIKRHLLKFIELDFVICEIFADIFFPI